MGRVGQQKEEHFGRSDHEVVRKVELSCVFLKKISSGIGETIRELKVLLHKKRPGVWISRTRQMPGGCGGFPVILA